MTVVQRSNLVDIACVKRHETELAWLLDDGTRKEWVPKSMVELHPEPDGTATAVMPERLAREKGFI